MWYPLNCTSEFSFLSSVLLTTHLRPLVYCIKYVHWARVCAGINMCLVQEENLPWSRFSAQKPGLSRNPTNKQKIKIPEANASVLTTFDITCGCYTVGPFWKTKNLFEDKKGPLLPWFESIQIPKALIYRASSVLASDWLLVCSMQLVHVRYPLPEAQHFPFLAVPPRFPCDLTVALIKYSYCTFNCLKNCTWWHPQPQAFQLSSPKCKTAPNDLGVYHTTLWVYRY